MKGGREVEGRVHRIAVSKQAGGKEGEGAREALGNPKYHLSHIPSPDTQLASARARVRSRACVRWRSEVDGSGGR